MNYKDHDWLHGDCEEHLSLAWQLNLQEPEEASPVLQDCDDDDFYEPYSDADIKKIVADLNANVGIAEGYSE